jgi:hypothetical protein
MKAHDDRLYLVHIQECLEREEHVRTQIHADSR